MERGSLKEMQYYENKMGYREPIVYEPVPFVPCNKCINEIPLGSNELGYVAIWWCKVHGKRANHYKKQSCREFESR
jgi:hypothetical protein